MWRNYWQYKLLHALNPPNIIKCSCFFSSFYTPFKKKDDHFSRDLVFQFLNSDDILVGNEDDFHTVLAVLFCDFQEVDIRPLFRNCCESDLTAQVAV